MSLSGLIGAPVPSGTDSSSSVPAPSPSGDTVSLSSAHHSEIILVLLIILAVILLPVVFNVIYERGRQTSSGSATSGRAGAHKAGGARSFFEIPYITWFVLHVMIAAVGTLSVVALALAGALDKATTAALLSGLFGYVLGQQRTGSSASSSPAQSTVTATASGRRQLTEVLPAQGPAAGGQRVALLGSGLATAATVQFGGTDATDLGEATDSALTVVTPAGTAGQTVDITVVFADGSQISHPQAFGFE